jgi:hypothetical protein
VIFFRNTIFKSITAGLLLALLVFIHVEKAVHHHENIITNTHQEGFSTASKSYVCSICDYVFARDAGLPDLPVAHIPVSYFEKEQVNFSSDYYSPVFFSITDRGPPTC